MARQVLEVFLSSTALDLAAYRDAVYARLARIEIFHCVRQEDFGARSAEAVAFCCEKARAADLFVGLVGMRRGWEPDSDSAKRSITEIEHDCAKEAGRRRFIWVSPNNFPVPGDIHETRAEHQRQLAFRKRVMAGGEIIASQKGFASPEELASTVVEQLLAYVMSSDLIKQIRPEVAAPVTDDLALKELPDAIVGKLMAALDARGEVAKAASGGLERDIIAKLAKRLKPDEALDFDQAVTELENAVGIALDSIARGEHGTNEDDLVKGVLERVAEQTKAGEFDRAAKVVDAALTKLDQNEAEQREALQRSRVTLLEAGIEQDILRRDASAVARRVERIAAAEEPGDRAKRFEILRRRQDTFHVEGRDKGLNFSLEIAIEVARLTLNRAVNADERGIALNDLGVSLQALGERESSTARLEEAVAAHREALKERTRERVPLDWAMSQNNLGIALQNLGARESGTARLRKAVTAYRDALKEFTRERMPLQWATTQNNLGGTLQTLGARESSTARLEEAVTAYRDALKERTRERVPLDWAVTQNNLGIALRNLGLRESGTARLEEAVTAYRDALKECTRERVPLYWATTQNNLGVALRNLGLREGSTARLEEAVTAYRDALKERTRERVPLDWAMTQNNLGIVLRNLGARASDTERLEEAVVACRAAIEVFKQAGASYYLEMAQGNLARAGADIASPQSSGSD